MRNKPYAGGFITEHYGEPALGRHALQIEINRALYMDERSLARRPDFNAVAADLRDAFAAGRGRDRGRAEPAPHRRRVADPPAGQKKGRTEVRPKSREETPKEGSDTATPIAISHCTIYAAPHKLQALPSLEPCYLCISGAKNAAVWPERNSGGVASPLSALTLSHSPVA